MRENFDEHAAFLTPIAVLTAAEALTHAWTLTAPGSKCVCFPFVRHLVAGATFSC